MGDTEYDLERGLLEDDAHIVPDRTRYQGFLGYLLSKTEVNPSPEELHIAKEIRSLVGVPYDPENPRHRSDVDQLWTLIHPGETAPPIPDDKWRTLGFQGKNPGTDFRGGGILSLWCIMYLSDKYPTETRKMIQESQTDRHFYLWAAACINVTVQLIFYLRLNKPDMCYSGEMKPAPTATKKNVLHLMSEEPSDARDSFGELFSKSVMKLHDIWMDMSKDPQVTMLDFGKALDKNLNALRRACNDSAKYKSLQDFAVLMQIEPDRWSISFNNYMNDAIASSIESLGDGILWLINATSSTQYAKREI